MAGLQKVLTRHGNVVVLVRAFVPYMPRDEFFRIGMPGKWNQPLIAVAMVLGTFALIQKSEIREVDLAVVTRFSGCRHAPRPTRNTIFLLPKKLSQKITKEVLGMRPVLGSHDCVWAKGAAIPRGWLCPPPPFSVARSTATGAQNSPDKARTSPVFGERLGEINELGWPGLFLLRGIARCGISDRVQSLHFGR